MVLGVRYGAFSDIGLQRKTNEDAFLATPPLFAVCDGMGGALAGEVASGLATETLLVELGEGSSLLAAAQAANATIFERARANPEQSGMGTTLTALVLEGEVGHFVHVGDSRAYLLRGGAFEQLSDDHSLVAELVRGGQLTAEEALSHPHRSILTRALGTESEVLIDEFEVDLRDGDTLLLCSDGLSSYVPEEEIAEVLGRAEPDAASRELIVLGCRYGGHDNITAVVIWLDATPSSDEDHTLILSPEEESVTVITSARPPEATPSPDDDASESDALPFDSSEAVEPARSERSAARSSRRRLGCLTALLATVVLALAVAAVTMSTVFFVGAQDGRLALYSGLPVKIGSLPLHVVHLTTATEYAKLSPAQRRLVDSNELHRKDVALKIIEDLGAGR